MEQIEAVREIKLAPELPSGRSRNLAYLEVTGHERGS
jgi:hypothetical protein